MIVQSLSWRGMRWAETMMSMVISTVLNAYKLDLGLGAALR